MRKPIHITVPGYIGIKRGKFYQRREIPICDFPAVFITTEPIPEGYRVVPVMVTVEETPEVKP